MNICSLVVHARPERVDGVQAGMERLPGVTVHGCSPDGKLVVTVEDAGESSASETAMSIHNLEGVLNAVLIYHYGSDDAPDDRL